MEILIIQPGGAYRAALFFAILPVVIVLLVLLVVRFQAIPKPSFLDKFGYLPLALLFVVYYGLLWQWLFYNQFYAVTKLSETQWKLEYLVPSRSHLIDIPSVADISTRGIHSFSGGATTARLVLGTRDGRAFRSAQFARHRADRHLRKLQEAAGGSD